VKKMETQEIRKGIEMNGELIKLVRVKITSKIAVYHFIYGSGKIEETVSYKIGFLEFAAKCI
jgi:hypothetical protein